MTKHFFIAGASGSGKTSIIPELKNLLPTHTVYDFDEIGVPENAGTLWRQKATEEWLQILLKEKQGALLCGQMVLGEILACPSASKLGTVQLCLLDVSDPERIDRLKMRGTYGANQNMLNWASWLRMHHHNPQWAQHVIKDDAWKGLNFSAWDKENTWSENVTTKIIDTTAYSIKEVAEHISQWIRAENQSKTNMESQELGLPIFYQQYPEYFDTPSDIYSTHEKNAVIEKILNSYGVKSVLDMACGTGAQVLYLAKRGYEVIGSDFSPGLLKIAREKAAQQELAIQFIDGDMRTLQVGKFDAIITIDNAIGHLVRDDFEVAIRNIHANLKNDGIYIFDILNLEAMTDEVVKSDSERMTDKRVTTDGTTIYNVRHSTIDRKNGYLTSENNFTIQKDGKQKKIKNKCTLQIYSMNELRNILSQNGFQIIEQYKTDTYTFKKDESGYSILSVAKKL